MIQVFKILHRYDKVSLENFQLADNNNRGHCYKLAKSFSKTMLGQNKFTYRVVNDWNYLSSDTVTASSVNSFKSSLNQDWKERPNKFSSA